MRTLAQIVKEVSESGDSQQITSEEWAAFRATFAANISSDIERIRAEQRAAHAKCQHLILD